MDKRPLGRSGLSIAPLMLGGNVFGWTLDETASFAVLDAFVGAGFDAIDTADVYSAWIPANSGGESETVLGNWFARSGKRDSVMLATKCGMKMPGGEGLSRDWIVRAVEDSLRRLRTDRIDLYQAHKDDEATPLDETLEAFSRLVADGKVRAIGASNYSAPRLSAALDIAGAKELPRYETLQPLYNLMDRGGFEEELQQLCVGREESQDGLGLAEDGVVEIAVDPVEFEVAELGRNALDHARGQRNLVGITAQEAQRLSIRIGKHRVTAEQHTAPILGF